VQDLGGAADGADLHDGVEDFDMAQTHRFSSLDRNGFRASVGAVA
jgi:hypothetical protein